MKYRAFGSIDFQTSQIGFGGASISGDSGGYGFGSISEEDAINLLHQAQDYGINLFDTAPCYGFGSSEVRMGKAFKRRRDQVFLVSKSGVTWDENMRVRKTNDPAVADKMLHQSLKDLQTDYIDLYMIHWPDDFFDIKDTMKVLSDAKKAGKIRYIGLCNTNAQDFAEASKVDTIDILQSNFNLFDQSAKNELFPLCSEKKLGFMSYGTLDKGILTGRVKPGRTYDKSDVRAVAKWWKSEDRAWKFAAMAEIEDQLNEWNLSPLSMALHGVLRSEHVSTALVGAKNLDQLKGVVEAANETSWDITKLEEIEKIIDAKRS